ncbi:uncharacterized protein LOC110443319 [Mizuhopecten yessoensis]|uniref:Fibroblast growth factor receptor 2 n=1 Tax=Mizuhopecten yessoensis TaxID=6573 RepID=A0A210PF72_MIZYE|nr:uncharacterized protein LOC110443319 [Mizuhopecten yessoensis]OWF35134.1 Fibroblast growth factor receptor 2 [Mizuhopecten yessoensis]
MRINEMKIVVFSLLALIAEVSAVISGPGPNVCTRRKRDYYYKSECVYFTWLGCCVFRQVLVCRYTTEYYCCSGYEDVGNTCKPVCNDACQNGGTCVSPNTCTCTPGQSGSNCGDVVCSHLRPCYPGICTLPSTCTCATGYTDSASNCTKVSIAPAFTSARAELAFFNEMKQMDVYNVTTDSTNPDSDLPDVLWTNLLKFNMWIVTMQAVYEPGFLPMAPTYIPEVKLGIISANISYELRASDNRLKTFGSQLCSPSPTILAPEQDILNCLFTFSTFDFRIDHADIFTITFSVQSGGFEKLNVIGTSTPYATLTFNGPTKQKSVEFKIDYVGPTHCIIPNSNLTCTPTSTPLQVTNPITKDNVTIKWSGWVDNLSGMYRYALEVFKLTRQGDILLEADPLGPVLITAFNDTSIVDYSFTYQPAEPGMYSTILEAADASNNSIYIRRFFLYDPVSSITVNAGVMKVTSATPESGYSWQDNQENTATAISVNWASHFINQLQADGGFLNAIQDYPPQLQDLNVDTSFKKVIDTDITDNSNRTSAAIPNIEGIVKFEVVYERKLVGVVPDPPATGWTTIDPMALYYNFTENVIGGDCMMIWVRAYDIMDNNATDATVVCFDSTDPIVRSTSLELNSPSPDFTAASRILMTTSDTQSGIASIQLAFYDNSTGALLYDAGTAASGNITNKTQTECDQVGDCYCITTGACYAFNYDMYFDNCWLYKKDLDLTTLVVRASLTSYNLASLFTKTDIMITSISSLDGLSACPGETTVVTVSSLSAGGIAAIALVIILILAFIIFVLILHKTGRLQKVKERSIERIRSIRGGANTGLVGYKQWQTGGFAEEDIYLYGTQTYEQAPSWMLHSDDLALGNIIVVGKFARIFEAILQVGGKPRNVVAKTLKENFTDQDSLLMTAKINFFGTKVGKHSCILDFIGAVTEDPRMGPVMVLEYCDNGPMNKWLQRNKASVNETVVENLYRFSYDIVRGMEYLASQEIIHMRLAARNILLTDRLEARISGFGPRQGDDEEEGEAKKERIPVKWIAPECLDSNKSASEKSDVWSYGIVLWEIFTIGETPYPDVRSRELPRYLRSGKRLPKPEYSDDTHFSIMLKTWQKSPKARPTFMDARKEIEHLFRQSSNDLYYYDSNLQ